MKFLIVIAFYILAINLITFLAFRYDKAQALAKGWRVSEQSLLNMAFVGGTIGAFWGRKVYRHKTRKEPFSTFLQLIAVVQIGALIGWFVLI